MEFIKHIRKPVIECYEYLKTFSSITGVFY